MSVSCQNSWNVFITIRQVSTSVNEGGQKGEEEQEEEEEEKEEEEEEMSSV